MTEIPTVNFSRNATYEGSNSGHVCTGISLFDNTDMVTMIPMHSRNGLGHCHIGIPKEDIQKLIDELEKLK